MRTRCERKRAIKSVDSHKTRVFAVLKHRDLLIAVSPVPHFYQCHCLVFRAADTNGSPFYMLGPPQKSYLYLQLQPRVQNMAPPPPTDRALQLARAGWRKYVPTTWDELQPRVSVCLRCVRVLLVIWRGRIGGGRGDVLPRHRTAICRF